MYPERLSGIENEVAPIAEESYAALSKNLNVEFEDKIRIYLSDEDEIKKAIDTRKNEGKHVIPVPKIEVKSRFPGYFIHSLELFFGKGQGSIKKEKTIVRPKFSYFGNLVIYNHVIRDLISYELSKESEIKEVDSIQIEKEDNEICVNIEIILKYGVEIVEYINSLQVKLNELIEKFTGLYLDNLNFYVSSLYVE